MHEGWRFRITLPAKEYIDQLDGPRKDELIEHIDSLAAAPFERLGRTVLGGLDAWTYEYESAVAEGLRVRVWLSDINSVARTILIEFITDEQGDPHPP